MLRAIGLLIGEQQLGLAGLACLICLMSSGTAVELLTSRAGSDSRVGMIRLAGAVLAFSTGAWTTHFIGILALHPGVPFGFDVGLCALSLVVVLGATAVAFAIEPADSGRGALLLPLKGLVLAAGIAAMHAISMRALLLPGRLSYQIGLVALSMGLGLGLAIGSMRLLARGITGLSAVALALGVMAIDGLGAASGRLVLAAGLPATLATVTHPVLVATTSGACVLILGLAIGASLLDQHLTRRLASDAQRFRTLADATFEGLILEKNGIIIDTNQAMGELAGLDPGALAGRTLSDVMPDLVLRSSSGRRSAELDVVLPDGSSRPVEVLWRDHPDRAGHVIAVRDLSRQRAAETLIDQLARLDPLTGLLNRDTFEHQVHKILAGSEKWPACIALLHVAIDRFDLLAELIGPSATEQLLIQVAQRLNGSVRQTDTVGRLSRDEFAVVQSLNGQATEAASLAERILADLGKFFAVVDQPLSVNISIGVALYPADGATARDLIHNAALASRQARQDGKGRWRYFESGMDRQVRARQMLQRDLRLALKHGQFTLNYQPFVDSNTLEIAGYEALLRWDHPERGRIPPADFVPAAEESGLIVPIGSWVLATACAEAMSWRRPAIIAVNLSPAQFEQTGIVATVSDVLRRTGLPPERLELEITETTLMEDKKKALQILTALKELGVRIAMDDFGTGYSSLSYLRTFPFDKIKIDRSFISDVEHTAEAETIVQAIIAMGMSLRLKVTAEGVETKHQLAMLRAYGCTFLQGYLLGRPRAAGQIEGRMEPLPRSSTEVSSSIADALPLLAAAATRAT